MNRMTWLLLILALLPAALLINLGVMAFIDDEGIRAAVALEMGWTGEWLVPRMHGDIYLNKPPLWNWLLAASFALLGRVDEWSVRLPTVLVLLGYCATIWATTRRHFGRWGGFLTAMIFLTCGRILFWDSMLGLIDICFSWVIYGLFMWVFTHYERADWRRLFLGAYTLAAVGFMLKGMPAIVFIGTTLVTWFAWNREWRKFFSVWHFVGGFLFLGIVGLYLWGYGRQADVGDLLARFFAESSKRTVVKYGVGESLFHFLEFPLEMTYHFLPWSVLVVYFLRRDIWRVLRADRFVFFCAFQFAANIIIYWLSPEVYPRYLLMHAPLIFIVYYALHLRHRAEKTWQYKGLYYLFGIMGVALAGGALVPFFLPQTADLPLQAVKSVGLCLAICAVTFLYFRRPRSMLPAFIVLILLLRIGFNWFALPARAVSDVRGSAVRTTSRALGETYRDRPLVIFGLTIMEPATTIYLEEARGSVVPRHLTDFESGIHYIVNPKQYPNLSQMVVDSLYVRHQQVWYRVGPLTDTAAADPKLGQEVEGADWMNE